MKLADKLKNRLDEATDEERKVEKLLASMKKKFEQIQVEAEKIHKVTGADYMKPSKKKGYDMTWIGSFKRDLDKFQKDWKL